MIVLHHDLSSVKDMTKRVKSVYQIFHETIQKFITNSFFLK